VYDIRPGHPAIFIKTSHIPLLSILLLVPLTTTLCAIAAHINKMAETNEVKSYGDAPITEKGITQVEDTHYDDQMKTAAQNKAAAVEAENAEHAMGVIDAVKAYPMAATWAVVMSCTIVRRPVFLAQKQ
jgi:hypothetical protein